MHPELREKFSSALEDSGIESSIMIRDVEEIIKRHDVSRLKRNSEGTFESSVDGLMMFSFG